MNNLLKPVVRTQDMEGNRLREVIAGHLAVQRSFNHEVIVSASSAFADSLYICNFGICPARDRKPERTSFSKLRFDRHLASEFVHDHLADR